MADDTTLVSDNKLAFDDISGAVQRILVDALGVPEHTVTPEAALIDDLGAESIDFIDIALRVERRFGIRLPTREWGEFARKQRGQLPMAELAQLFDRDYGVRLSAEEQEDLAKFGLRLMCDRIRARHGVDIPAAARLDWARRGMQRHMDAFESLFAQTLAAADFERLVELASVDVHTEDFTRALRRLFTVKMLCQFIAASLSRRSVEN